MWYVRYINTHSLIQFKGFKGYLKVLHLKENHSQEGLAMFVDVQVLPSWFNFLEHNSGSIHRWNLKTRQSPVIWIRVWENSVRESCDCRDVVACDKLRFQKVFYPRENKKPAFPNSSGIKSVFEKHRFHDGLAWTEGLTVEIKLRFRDRLVWTVGLNLEIKLRFCDRLVWTVGLTVEITELRFQISPALVWMLLRT